LRLSDDPGGPSLVLAVADTVRRDRLGVYGGPARTPAFDRFARENHYFAHAYTQAPWTKPSIATLFTSLYPSQHGMLSHPELPVRGREGRTDVLESDVLREELTTLAEVLAEAGYRTAAFVANPWLQKSLGFAQGFQVYDDSFAANDTPGRVVTDAGLAWLRSVPDSERYFLYLHYMDAHGPYPELRPSDVESRADLIRQDRRVLHPKARRAIRSMARYEDGTPVVEPGLPPNLALLELVYDRGVEHFDDALGSLLAGLQQRPDFEATAMIVTSDHGEALFERGWGQHGYALFDNETAVPLAMRLPGVSGTNPVECSVGLIDLMPTLCTYLGVECPADTSFGSSLLVGSGGDATGRARYVVSEGVIAKPRHRSIRNRHYKLLFQPEGSPVQREPARAHSLYEIEDDGGEVHDLLAQDDPSPELQRVFETLSDALAASVPPAELPKPAHEPLDEATRQRLEELGYLED
jgi:arylsulfatase A-like enzyme